MASDQAQECFYSNVSVVAACYKYSIDLTLWVNDAECIPPRYSHIAIYLTNGSEYFKYAIFEPIDIEENKSIIIKDIAIANSLTISDAEYRKFLLRVKTGYVTISDSAVSEFSATYTLKKIDILCSNYSLLWGESYLVYNLPKSMGGHPKEEPMLCVDVYGQTGTFPESSLLYFSASLVLLSELSGATITVPIQRGKNAAEFKYAGIYYHNYTYLFCYNCSTVDISEKELCEKLISKFASLELHTAALQLSSKFEQTTESLPTIQFEVRQVINNYYNYNTEDYQYYLDTNYFPIFIAENEMHLVANQLNYIFDKPKDTAYTDVSFIFYSLDDYHLKEIYLKLSYTYVHPITSRYFWLLFPSNINYDYHAMAKLALNNQLKGELVVKHMNSKNQIQSLEIAKFSTILPSCIGKALAILHRSSISLIFNLFMTPDVTMSCLISSSDRVIFTSIEYMDNSTAVYIDDKVQLYIILYYFPKDSNINRDMHLIGTFFTSLNVSDLGTEINIGCDGNWIGYSKHDWPMSCLYQLNQARHHMMSGDLRAVVRVHNSYQLIDTFFYDEIRSATPFVYVLLIVSFCCIFVVFIYYCIVLCKFYRRLLRYPTKSISFS